MISTDFITLTAEFMQHGIILALVGIVAAEFFRYPKPPIVRADLIRIAIVVLCVAVWLIAEFFFATSDTYLVHLLLYLPHVIAIPMVFFPMAHRYGVRVTYLSFFLFSLVALNVLLGVFAINWYVVWMDAFRELLKVMIAGVMYFLVLQIFIQGTAAPKNVNA